MVVEIRRLEQAEDRAELTNRLNLAGTPEYQRRVVAGQTDRELQAGTAPLLHGGWAHLEANTIPVLVLSFLVLASGVKRGVGVTAIIWVSGGLVSGSSLRRTRSPSAPRC